MSHKGSRKTQHAVISYPRKGCQYHTLVNGWSDVAEGQTWPAEILQTRVDTDSNTGQTVMKYYVHFLGRDRRLDEWVTSARFTKEVARLTRRSSIAQLGDGHGGGHNKRGSQKRRVDEMLADSMHESMHSPIRSVHGLGHHDPKTKVRNIQRVRLGKYDMGTWYYSPYPDHAPAAPVEQTLQLERLYVCEFTFKYMISEAAYNKHLKSVPPDRRRPPGRQIYDDPNRKIAAFEMVGAEHVIYCQNLCLFAKLFIEHKTLFYDVVPFIFYVLTEYDDDGHHPVGYFSKEIDSAEKYNLACILTFPACQRKGYGRFLISLSYVISQREKKTGSPEKPLSDLGKVSYRSYWTFVLLRLIREVIQGKRDDIGSDLTLEKICNITAFKLEDVVSTLESLNMIKVWKGQNVIYFTRKMLDAHLAPFDRRNFGAKFCLPHLCTWEPPKEPLKVPTDKPPEQESAAGVSQGTSTSSAASK
eukprot:g3401.t1